MGQAQSKKKKHEIVRNALKFESKEEYFIKNGSILLKNQIAISQGRDLGTRELKIFSNKEIEKATNNYDPNLIFYEGQANMYKATLDNHHIVSVKAPPMLDPNPELTSKLLMGASTRTVMNHEYMLQVYGCCLETYIPMLVCEYFPNGTLFQHLHDDAAPNKCMLWGDHLRVVTETAYALSYMHNALPKPLVHRQVTSSSIYLDCIFRAKLGRFGNAVSITPGDTSQRWPVEGTMGYIDPEYIETREITDKCDVYSFGVIMIEIITRKQPFVFARGGINLVDAFVSAAVKNQLQENINSKVLEEASWDDIQGVVQLALACVEKKGIDRPTMIDVVGELRKIQDRDKSDVGNLGG